MGRPKTLLEWRGAPLIRRVAESAIASRVVKTVVVVGCEAGRVREALEGLPVEIVEHPEWREGLGTSVAAGTQFLSRAPDAFDAVVVLLADQPLVETAVIDRLIAAHRGPDGPPVAAIHRGGLGVPALFPSRLFGALRSLRGDAGARDVLRENASSAVGLEIPEAAVDVDTPEDYEELTRRPR